MSEDVKKLTKKETEKQVSKGCLYVFLGILLVVIIGIIAGYIDKKDPCKCLDLSYRNTTSFSESDRDYWKKCTRTAIGKKTIEIWERDCYDD